MASVLDMPRSSSTRRSGYCRIEVPTGALTVPQRFASHTLPAWCGEDTVAENQRLGSAILEDALPHVKPLPWRQCAVLMVLGSVAVYGLGFLVVAAFNHLFAYLQL